MGRGGGTKTFLWMYMFFWRRFGIEVLRFVSIDWIDMSVQVNIGLVFCAYFLPYALVFYYVFGDILTLVAGYEYCHVLRHPCYFHHCCCRYFYRQGLQRINHYRLCVRGGCFLHLQGHRRSLAGPGVSCAGRRLVVFNAL